ncbi:hypothetical protein Poli38472_012001 [Pythium oligandrum]|uniref:glucan 1,3-beta-glucosidase n=1 Tax=Pythium oligandrum TaxID=41045 RepID=A0A8K1FK96_PYTOL|nr:hypothetical protein Poli38472_012001 [Pythium oligandrum]|eukprot:TMW66885.1 hypothetical protein Poli38472_012001 [Pythium oligandrum]
MFVRLLKAVGICAALVATLAAAECDDEYVNPAVQKGYSFDDLVNTTTPSQKPSTAPSPVPSSVGSATPPASGHVQAKIRAGEVKSRGVNLGGWLVTEKWMNAGSDIWNDVPAQYSGGGEYVTMKHGSNVDDRRKRFTKHHDTFIMENDIREIAEAGLNTVRVPVGYWITGADPSDISNKGEWKAYPQGTLAYVDRLIREWGVKHNVAVMISIHAAKGSQNGQDHSAPAEPGKAYWSKYQENVDNTLYVAKFLADRYKDDAAFLGLCLLNEPNADTSESVVNQYYQDAYKAIRDTGNDCILSIMPMLYKQTAENLNGFMEAPKYTNVWVEWHPYFLWGYEDVSADDLVNKSILQTFDAKIKKWVNRAGANKMFFGEWSLGNAGQYKNADSDGYKKWTQAQMTVMNQASAGWTFWSWHIEGDDKNYNAWSLRSVLHRDALKQIVMKN